MSVNRCRKHGIYMYLQVLSILTEIWWNMSDFPRTGFLILLYSFRWSVAQAKWRTACVKFLQWRFWQGEWWKSIDEAPWLESALGLLYLVTLATDPLSPSSHMSLCLPCNFCPVLSIYCTSFRKSLNLWWIPWWFPWMLARQVSWKLWMFFFLVWTGAALNLIAFICIPNHS